MKLVLFNGGRPGLLRPVHLPHPRAGRPQQRVGSGTGVPGRGAEIAGTERPDQDAHAVRGDALPCRTAGRSVEQGREVLEVVEYPVVAVVEVSSGVSHMGSPLSRGTSPASTTLTASAVPPTNA